MSLMDNMKKLTAKVNVKDLNAMVEKAKPHLKNAANAAKSAAEKAKPHLEQANKAVAKQCCNAMGKMNTIVNEYKNKKEKK